MATVHRLYRTDPFTSEPELVRKRLLRKFRWPLDQADDTVKQIQSLSPSLRPAFQAFWNTGLFDASLRAGKFTMGQLVEVGLSPMGAFLALDDVHKQPREASHDLGVYILRRKQPKQPGRHTHINYARPPKPRIETW
jgi:hypothetical protein